MANNRCLDPLGLEKEKHLTKPWNFGFGKVYISGTYVLKRLELYAHQLKTEFY